MATYQRGSGDHVAERVQAEPGSDEERELQEKVDRGEGGWYRVDAPKPKDPPAGGGEGDGSGPGDDKLPARSASKADWVTYAVAHGVDQEDADKATRDELAERFHEGGGS